MRLHVFAPVFLFIALAPPALADPPPRAQSEAEAEAEARELYQKGLVKFDVADYDEAIALFKRAYEVDHAPPLLFNIAQSYRLKKDYDRAREVYRTYLRLLPDAPNRADVEALIAEVSDAIEKDKLERFGSIGSAAGATASVVAPVLPPVPPWVVAPVSPLLTSTASARPRRSRALLIAGITIGAVGVTALAVGGAFAARQSSDADELAALRARGVAWGPDAQSIYDDGTASATAATALFATGGLLAAAGGALTIAAVAHRSPARARARAAGVAVAPLPGGAAALWSCAF
jgi:tetratricopeptide (TPR) repeat protein